MPIPVPFGVFGLLSLAGIGKRWLIYPYRIEKILGLSTDDFSALADLSNEQRAFLRALANTGSVEPQSANEIARLASATYGVRFPEKSLPKLILNELEDNGYIRTEKTTSGRGAKPFQVTPTDKLVADIMKTLLSNGYTPKMRPSGHDISDKFAVNNGAAIPPNLIAIPNTESNSAYMRYCKKRAMKVHPARFPAALPEYFIRMLTDIGDLVLDPFAGSCVTGEVAERLKRKWVCIEILESYLEGALGRFSNAPLEEECAKPKTNKSNGNGYYKIPHPGLLWQEMENESSPLPKDGGKERPSFES